MSAPVGKNYFDLIATRESGSIKSKPLDSESRYSTVNSYDYLGKYQVGTAALIDAGFYSGPVNKSTQNWDDTKWTAKAQALGVNSRADFLSNAAAQEVAMKDYTDKNWSYLVNFKLDAYVGKTVSGVEITPEGLLAGTHLVGIGSTRKFVESGVGKSDANGTTIQSYMSIFSPSIPTIDSDVANINGAPGWKLYSSIDSRGVIKANLIDPFGNIALNAGPGESLIRVPDSGTYTLSRKNGAVESFDLFTGTRIVRGVDGSGYISENEGAKITPFSSDSYYIDASGVITLRIGDAAPFILGVTTGSQSASTGSKSVNGADQQSDQISVASKSPDEVVIADRRVDIGRNDDLGTLVRSSPDLPGETESLGGTGGNEVTQYDPLSGYTTYTRRDSNGQVLEKITTDKRDVVVGDSYVSDGVTFTRTVDTQGGVQWLDPNGNTPAERLNQGSKDSDAHLYRPTEHSSPKISDGFTLVDIEEGRYVGDLNEELNQSVSVQFPLGGDNQVQETLNAIAPTKVLSGEVSFDFDYSGTSPPFIASALFDPFGAAPIFTKENDVQVASAATLSGSSIYTATDIGHGGAGFGSVSSSAVFTEALTGSDAHFLNHPQSTELLAETAGTTQRVSDSTPIDSNAPFLATVKAFVETNAQDSSFSWQSYIDRINRSPDLVVALNSYQDANQVIDINPNLMSLSFNVATRELTINPTALLSPTWFTRALAHEIYGHDNTRAFIASVLDPNNPLYQGKTPSEVNALVQTGCFAAETLGAIGEYRIGQQAGFTATGYRGVDVDITVAIDTVKQFLPSNTDTRTIDLAAAQFIATKVQASDVGHAEQCANWAQSVVNQLPDTATSSPVAQMVFSFDLSNGNSTVDVQSASQVVNTVVNGDGTTTRTISTTDGEFTRTVHSVTYGTDGQIQAEDQYSINTLDNTRTPLGANGITVTKAVSTPPEILDPSDAHFTRYPAANDAPTSHLPLAPVDTDQPAPNSVATKTPEQLHAEALLDAQVADAGTMLSFASSIIGLKNWESQDDLGHITTLVNLYNNYNQLGAAVDKVNNVANTGDGTMGQVGAGLNFLGALRSGNNTSIGSSGLSLYNSLGGTGPGGASLGPMVGVLNLAGALDSGDNWAIASSVASLFPPWGTVAAVVINLIGNAVGRDIPEPPQGAIHYEWDDNGNIQIQTDQDISRGGAVAHRTGENVINLIQTVVSAQNTTNDAAGLSHNNLAIDPSRLPRVGTTAGTSWLEITNPDGTVTKETLDYDTIGTRLLQIAIANDALAPVWQIQTARTHAQTAQAHVAQTQAAAVQATQEWDAQAIDGHNRPVPGTSAVNQMDMDGRAPAADATPTPVDVNNNPSVFGTKGTGTESADHKTISYGALVVHLGTPGAQQAINDIKTSTALSDTDGDGFWEQTQWVAGQDSNGNVQGMLVLDSNANGLIETADILHMGANSNQRNSMNWLDANGDGKLDANDPAFAAIKVFIDLNNNGRVDDGEMQSPGLSSINFTTGQINYSNGTSDALTVATLTAETEGARVETIKFVGEDGKLYETSAGSVTVHEGYQGLVRVNNKGEIVADDDPAADNRWVQQRINSYEFDAVHMRDWEGTDAQDQHRHGGTNVASAPTATAVTGVSSMGAVLGKENVKTSTTMDVGDKRIVSDAPRTHTVSTGTTAPANPTTITLNAGDARIRSLTPPAESTTRVAFVPSGVRDGWMTADGKELLHLPEDNLFGNGGMGGALMAVAIGAVQTTAFALPEPGATGFTWQTKPLLPNAPNTATHNSAVNLNTDGDRGSDSAFNIAIGNYTPTVRHVRLGVQISNAPVDHPAHVPTYVVGNGPAAPTVRGGWQTTVYDMGNPPLALAPDGSPQPSQTVIYNPATGKPTTSPTPTTNTAPAPVDSAPGAATTPSAPPASSTSPTPVTTPSAPTSPTFTAPPASPPTNTSAGTTNDNLSNPLEDLPLHVDFATLLANDTNASSITLVGNATHGTVAIVGSQVVFTPAPNYHGPASFQYQVVSTDGSFAVGQANFDINAANDVPVALGETATATEDTVLLISPASLLANDTDADVATDGQTLSISAVGNATHGTVSLVNGQVQFTADANYHGTASFKYVVSDGHGGTATATATVQVAAVNDLPVALGEVIASAEDTTLLINPAALLANDTDADIATDNQVLSISAVSNATHGTVSILGTGQIQFIPDANYVGNASFDYVVSDGHGGTVTTTANILVGSTNDAPVASGETVNSQEDQVVTLTAAALLANETDIDNTISSLQIARVTAGAGGSVVLSNGNVIFTPNANFSGTASFTYWVKDPDGMESNPATVTVNVAPVNDAPYAQGEVLSGASEDATFTIDRSTLLANDGDEEDGNGSLGIELVGGASSGTVSIGAGGNVVFTPVANFNGNVSFQYQVRDSSGALSPTVTAQFNVAPVNDTPLGVDEQLTPMYTNTSASPSTATIGFTTLLANDQDVDNPHSALTVSGVRNANNGTVSIVNGAVSFTPTLNFNGTASFEYQVDDQHGGQTWATAFISVAPPPNAYPAINVTHFNFYPTGTTPAGAWDIGELNWTIADDGNTGLVSVTYLSGSYHIFGNAGGNVSSLPWNDFITTQTSWYVNVPRSHAVDAFSTTWRVVDDRGLENTWTFSYTVGSGYSSTMQFPGYVPPIVLGLNGFAPHYIETQYSNVRFDLNGDGVADQVAWAAPGSGVLGIDLDGDHQISNASEFAFSQYVPGAKTDLEGLRAFDSNQNGLLDAGDAQWAKFGVWEDKNSDGQTQEGEYMTLDTLGIANINLNGHTPTQPQEKPADGHLTGVAVVGESTFTRTDGSTGQVDDAMFAFQTAPQNDAADLMRMALLFNQYSNTAIDGSNAPLAYVPMQADAPWQEAALLAPPHAMQEALQGA